MPTYEVREERGETFELAEGERPAAVQLGHPHRNEIHLVLVELPEDEGGVCGAETSSGTCQRETDGGRCWQH